MSTVTASLEQTASIEQEPFDFEAFLASRWGVEREQAVTALERWMASHRSAEARSRPGPSGVHACPEAPDAQPTDEADVA